MGMGLGIGLGRTIGGNNRSWTTRTNFWIQEDSRSELTLTDYYGNDASILLPYLYDAAGTGYYKITDNGALDIGANDTTLCCWARGEEAAGVIHYLCGKNVNGSLNGRYGITINAAGYFAANCQPSGGVKTIASTVVATSGWHFLQMEIEQATHKFRFFVDNVQQGVDIDWTGTFAATANDYGFYIKSGNNSGGTGVSYTGKASISDVGLWHRLLTPTEKVTLFARGFVTGAKAYYPLMGYPYACFDASGNSYHGLGTSLTSANFPYSNMGSRWGLDVGFTQYSNGTYRPVYVPTQYDGTEIVPSSTYLEAGYKITPEGIHLTDSLNHNLANSLIAMPGTEWDRSDTNRFTDEATSTQSFYDSTSATTKKYWHVSELNNLLFQAWGKSGYRVNWVRMTDYSYKNRKKLIEIATCTEELLTKAMAYCGDYVVTDTYENDYIYWEYDTNSIIATRGNKMLKWENAATDKFHLSLDNGVTYPYSINSPFNGIIPEFAHIFANGNILIGGKSILYLSTDNLSTLSATTVKDILGNDYVHSDHCFNAFIRDQYVDVSGTEILVWGCYRNEALGADTDINAWYTIDDGVTVKSCYKVAVTNPPNLPAKHIHSINYKETITGVSYFWMTTGDNSGAFTAESNIIELAYTWATDTWVATKLFGDADGGNTYKLGPVGFYDSSIVTTDDNTSVATWNGIWTSAIADLGNTALRTVIFKWLVLGNGIMNLPEFIVALGTTVDAKALVVTSNGIANIHGSKLFGLPTNIVSFNIATEKNTNGWYLLHLRYNGDYVYRILGNQTLWVKIK